ncbi:MAG: TetR family transcriptional regulator, partial [Chloroflexota bacterium]
MKKTAEEAAITKQKLLTAALTIFSKNGYKATRLQDIAAEAEVTRGAIYHHFGNKAGLFLALMKNSSEAGNQIVPQAIAEGGTFVEIIERIMIRGFELIENDRVVRETMRLYLFNAEMDDELADFRDFLKQQAVDSIKATAQFMQIGIDGGELRPTLDPETAARSFIAFQNGIYYLWLANPQAFSIKKQAAELTQAFL